MPIPITTPPTLGLSEVTIRTAPDPVLDKDGKVALPAGATVFGYRPCLFWEDGSGAQSAGVAGVRLDTWLASLAADPDYKQYATAAAEKVGSVSDNLLWLMQLDYARRTGRVPPPDA